LAAALAVGGKVLVQFVEAKRELNSGCLLETEEAVAPPLCTMARSNKGFDRGAGKPKDWLATK
jgi:hypothetical protein